MNGRWFWRHPGSRVTALLICVSMLFAGGCSMLPQKTQETEQDPSRYTVYYTNAEHLRLVKDSFLPASQTFEGIQIGRAHV